ncbi:MAG: AMIN domain-containing protein, partial [Nitrosospira sp.]|nr:AMIN domain-containing protein [Nitrosospira sp.]
MAAPLLLFIDSSLADTRIASVRVWPATEYTRFTLESASPSEYSVSTVKNPDRVVIDLKDVIL